MYTAPAISAGFGAIVYLLIKYIVLVRKDPTRWGLYTAPFFFFTLANYPIRCVLDKVVKMTDIHVGELPGSLRL